MKKFLVLSSLFGGFYQIQGLGFLRITIRAAMTIMSAAATTYLAENQIAYTLKT